MKKIWITMLLITFTVAMQSKDKNVAKAEVKGQVFEVVNGKSMPLPFANVLCKGTVEGTVAGTEGDFSMNLKDGKYTVLVSCYGYEPVELELKVKGGRSLDKFNIELTPLKDQIALK